MSTRSWEPYLGAVRDSDPGKFSKSVAADVAMYGAMSSS
jgi:hypothetical protein